MGTDTDTDTDTDTGTDIVIEARAAGSVLPNAARWAAARTRARAEKALAAWLGERGVAVYLPVCRKRRVYGARVRESELPLFPGYLFFDAGAIERERVFSSRKVAQVLEAGDAAELERELENLARAMGGPEPVVRARAVGLGRGAAVVVRHGPLAGVWGEVVREGGRARLVVRVSLLAEGAELEIDPAFLEPVAGG